MENTSKYSIMNDEHIYYEISEKYRAEIESFVSWLSTLTSDYEVGADYVKVGDNKVLFDNNRPGIIRCVTKDESFETWWNVDSENFSAKRKIKQMLGL